MNIKFLSPAKAEMRKAARFYERETIGLGVRFVDEIEAAIRMIDRFPLSGVLITETVRRVLLRKFPFAVLFVYTSDTILIVAVAHLHRDPDYWKSRVD